MNQELIEKTMQYIDKARSVLSTPKIHLNVRSSPMLSLLDDGDYCNKLKAVSGTPCLHLTHFKENRVAVVRDKFNGFCDVQYNMWGKWQPSHGKPMHDVNNWKDQFAWLCDRLLILKQQGLHIRSFLIDHPLVSDVRWETVDQARNIAQCWALSLNMIKAFFPTAQIVVYGYDTKPELFGSFEEFSRSAEDLRLDTSRIWYEGLYFEDTLKLIADLVDDSHTWVWWSLGSSYVRTDVKKVFESDSKYPPSLTYQYALTLSLRGQRNFVFYPCIGSTENKDSWEHYFAFICGMYQIPFWGDA